MYAVTRTGTTVKRLRTDVKLVTSGNNLGIRTVPFINLKSVIPTVITRNTTASATDKADVYLNESANTDQRKIQFWQMRGEDILQSRKRESARSLLGFEKKIIRYTVF